METPNHKIPAFPLLPCILLLLMSVGCIWADQSQSQTLDRFLRCLHSHDNNNSNYSISRIIYTPRNYSSYESTLLLNIQNQRFASPRQHKPLLVVTPLRYSHVQSVVSCARTHQIQIRTRCGGHDYEGLSYISYYHHRPFVVLDLRHLRSISVDAKARTAWVQGGSRLGELYYNIADKSSTLGFPAGLCPTVGVGGHISGGGEGTLSRKYGLAADHVVDAKIVDANGNILDRKAMGEDVFWAIRGGGGASFGVILAYKINLVPVPKTVTAFTLNRTLEQNATKLVHLWQLIAPKLDRDLFIRVVISQKAIGDGKVTVNAAFNSLFLGTAEKLLSTMKESFSELGLKREDCRELRWIEAAVYFSELPAGSTVRDLLRKEPYPKYYYKAKSDYVVDPISVVGLEGLWRRFKEPAAKEARLILAPYGGRMAEISESEIPFPHRAGNLYQIQHFVSWVEKENANHQIYIDWIRRLYKYITPYVSKSPRVAYLNYRDLDLGENKRKNTSFAEASKWGFKYFKNNFYRLAQVKAAADPSNFFSYEQSIPPLPSSS